MKIHNPSYLPLDVVETILCRLPVKSLLRLKAVSKQWSDAISDPIFVHMHLQKSQNSPCSFIQPEIGEPYLQTETVSEAPSLRRVTLENNEFRELSPLEDPPPFNSGRRSWCFCNGLFLISLFYANRYRQFEYVLWNPSRRTHKGLFFPYPVDRNPRQRCFGICYNRSEKDYKVVIIYNVENYAVFSCKNKSWREMRCSSAISFQNFKTYPFHRTGVAYKESVYWAMHSELDDRPQIVFFDGRDDKLKILCNLDYARNHSLFASQDGLYLIPLGFGLEMEREMVIRKILPVWMEYKLKLPFSYMHPLGFTRQNKLILLHFFDRRNCRLCDCSAGCFEDTVIQPSFDFSLNHLLPYMENLFFL